MHISRPALQVLAVLAVAGAAAWLYPPRSPGPAAPAEPAAAHASQPAPHSAVSLSLPVFLKKDAVICPQMTVLGAFLDGHRAGGDTEGHRAVADLFVHPRGGCTRTLRPDRVRVLDAAISDDKLVKIDWTPGMGPYLALALDLSN